MAKMITWLGEGDDGPHAHEWAGYRFEAGKAVKVTDPYVIRAAGDHRYWKQEDCPDHKPTPADKESAERLAKAKAEAVTDAEAKAVEEQHDREENEFKHKVAAQKAQANLKENERFAAEQAKRRAMNPKNHERPRSTNDDGAYREVQ